MALIMVVAAIIGSLVATGVGPALADKFVTQVSCLFGGSCESGDLDGGPVAQEGAPAAGDAPDGDAPPPAEPPAPPAKTQAQLDFEAAQQALDLARTEQRTSDEKAKAIAKELAEILADELGLKNPFECVMTMDLATCGQAALDVLTGLIGGGAAGKFAKKYWKPWDWEKAAGKIKKVVGLAWDLKGRIGSAIDARGKVKNAEDTFNTAKAKLDAENAAKPKPEDPKKPPKKPDEEEEEPEKCPQPHSFLARTPVLFGDGSRRPIESVRLGDRVVATNPLTGRTAVRPVTRTIRTTDDKHFTVLTVLSGGRTQQLTATDTHPFWLTDLRRWADAGDIVAGAGLRTPEGRTVPVTAVRHYTQRQTTYDLTVDEIHTYYVLAGATPVLVHNNNCEDKVWEPYREDVSHDFQGPLPADAGIPPGSRLAPGYYTFIVRPDGSVRAIHDEVMKALNPTAGHVSLGENQGVIMAGRFVVDTSGRIIEVDNFSGHYAPKDLPGFTPLEDITRAAFRRHGWDIGDSWKYYPGRPGR
ncbi:MULTISPECIES: polymorphic toxin-type HINT domain-containing protein [Streptomyces]|uniref:Polymorphic toxin-type HINT domain-containing protein n=1 Tax=Streptomyces solicathayae TaxID=3081768 RepID=A0ABZ0LZR7_9ACTN|nr:polymorphic toxin-type HINT domain-containing protein [Streptomyces sp. HUAS YS2]WOX24998.1 polymorphic toxin-type HINT domain-containing protein [Streptomyces sp. HUAS YS2]